MGDVGKNHKIKETSTRETESNAPQITLVKKRFSKAYVQIHCKTRGNEYAKIKSNVIKIFTCKEKVTFERKKYEIRVIIKDTVRAEDKSAIVRIEDTAKIFWLKRSEYNPNAYKEAIAILVRKRAGTRK